MAGKRGRQSLGKKVRQERFMVAFRELGVVALAARRIGITRQQVYAWCDADPTFKTALQNAQEEIVDELERVARDLATGKLERPLVSAGKIVGHERIYDTRSLELLLKTYRPRFRERSGLEITGANGGPVKVVTHQITETLVADVTQILLDAGAIGDHETLALRAAAGPPPTENALADMREARQ